MAEFIPQNIAQSLYDLLAKLDDLKASLDAGLTVTVDPNVTVNVQGCGGCTGGGGAGMVESPPELAPPPGSAPDGYTDTDEWLQRRCGIIEQVIYPNWQRDLEQINNLDLAGLSIELVSSAILIVVLTPIPFDDILLLAAIIAGFLLIGIAHNNVMNPAIDYVANLDPCILASASSPQAAVQALLNDIEAQEFDVLIDSYTKGVLRSFVNVDLVNILFAPNPPLSASVTSANCDGCSSTCWQALAATGVEDGVIIARDIQAEWMEITMTPTLVNPGGGCEQYVYRFGIRGDLLPGCQWVIDSIAEDSGVWSEYFCHPLGSPPEDIDGFGFYKEIGEEVQKAVAKADFVGPTMDGIVTIYSTTDCQLTIRIVAP